VDMRVGSICVSILSLKPETVAVHVP
jgi:hypothetical protein